MPIVFCTSEGLLKEVVKVVPKSLFSTIAHKIVPQRLLEEENNYREDEGDNESELEQYS